MIAEKKPTHQSDDAPTLVDLTPDICGNVEFLSMCAIVQSYPVNMPKGELVVLLNQRWSSNPFWDILRIPGKSQRYLVKFPTLELLSTAISTTWKTPSGFHVAFSKWTLDLGGSYANHHLGFWITAHNIPPHLWCYSFFSKTVSGFAHLVDIDLSSIKDVNGLNRYKDAIKLKIVLFPGKTLPERKDFMSLGKIFTITYKKSEEINPSQNTQILCMPSPNFNLAKAPSNVPKQLKILGSVPGRGPISYCSNTGRGGATSGNYAGGFAPIRDAPPVVDLTEDDPEENVNATPIHDPLKWWADCREEAPINQGQGKKAETSEEKDKVAWFDQMIFEAEAKLRSETKKGTQKTRKRRRSKSPITDDISSSSRVAEGKMDVTQESDMESLIRILKKKLEEGESSTQAGDRANMDRKIAASLIEVLEDEGMDEEVISNTTTPD